MLPIFTLYKYPSMRTWLCMQDSRHKYYSVVVLVAATSKMLMLVHINTGHLLNGCGHACSPLLVLVQSLNKVYYRKCEKYTHNTLSIKNHNWIIMKTYLYYAVHSWVMHMSYSNLSSSSSPRCHLIMPVLVGFTVELNFCKDYILRLYMFLNVKTTWLLVQTVLLYFGLILLSTFWRFYIG